MGVQNERFHCISIKERDWKMFLECNSTISFQISFTYHSSWLIMSIKVLRNICNILGLTRLGLVTTWVYHVHNNFLGGKSITYTWPIVNCRNVYIFEFRLSSLFCKKNRPHLACATDKPVVSDGGNLRNVAPFHWQLYHMTRAGFEPAQLVLRDGEQFLQNSAV